jgi:hypothetical protein
MAGSGGTIKGATDTTSYGGDVSVSQSGPVSLSYMEIENSARNAEPHLA